MSPFESVRALLAEGTPGPWEYTGDVETVALTIATDPYANERAGAGTGMGQWPADATLIASAVNALPALLDVAEAAREYVKGDPGSALKRALDRLDGAS